MTSAAFCQASILAARRVKSAVRGPVPATHRPLTAPLTRLLEPSAPATRFGDGCGGAVGRQLDHRCAEVFAHLRS